MVNPRLDRIERLPQVTEAVFHSLATARILVIGAGGLGVPVLMYLANSGIMHIGICEADVVSESNLHRQVAYTLKDCGTGKAETIVEFLKARNPGLMVQLHPFIDLSNAEGIISAYDVIIDGSDNFGTRYLVNDMCCLLGKPLVSGSVYQFEGQLGVWNVALPDGRYSTNYRDIFPEMPNSLLPDCNTAGVTGPLCGVIGSLMAQEALKISGMPGKLLTDTLCVFDALTNSWQYLVVQEHPENPIRMGKSLQDQYSAKCDVSTEITWEDLYRWDEEHYPYLLIDVRTAEEFEQYHVGGISVPLASLETRLFTLPTDRTWVFHCQSGVRSSRALALAASFPAPGKPSACHVRGGLNSKE